MHVPMTKGKMSLMFLCFLFVCERIIQQFLSPQEACTSTNYEIRLRDITISLHNLKSLFNDIQ